MKKKKLNEITDCLLDNDDYFYRDNEMFRTDLNNIEHQVDPTFDLQKDGKKIKK